MPQISKLKSSHEKELEDKVEEVKVDKQSEIQTLTDDGDNLKGRLESLSNSFFLQFVTNKKSEVDRLKWLEYDFLANLCLTTNDTYGR